MRKRKVHMLLPYRVGLFQHLSTYCSQAGNYIRDGFIRHYRTGARFDYTNYPDRITCKSCLAAYEEFSRESH